MQRDLKLGWQAHGKPVESYTIWVEENGKRIGDEIRVELYKLKSFFETHPQLIKSGMWRDIQTGLASYGSDRFGIVDDPAAFRELGLVF